MNWLNAILVIVILYLLWKIYKKDGFSDDPTLTILLSGDNQNIVRALAENQHGNAEMKYEFQPNDTLMLTVGEKGDVNQPQMVLLDRIHTSSDCNGVIIAFAHSDKSMLDDHAKQLQYLVVKKGDDKWSTSIVWAGDRSKVKCFRSKFCECFQQSKNGVRCNL